MALSYVVMISKLCLNDYKKYLHKLDTALAASVKISTLQGASASMDKLPKYESEAMGYAEFTYQRFFHFCSYEIPPSYSKLAIVLQAN
jgi:hypothetical protein